MSSTAEQFVLAPLGEDLKGAKAASAPAISCCVVSSIERLAALGADWLALERTAAADHQFFQTFAWCMHWVRAAEELRRDVGLRIITVRDAGRLVLVWPLCIDKGRFGTTATWLGEPLTQYGDILVEDGPQRTRWIDAAWSAALSLEGVDMLWLRRVRADAVVRPLLATGARQLPEMTEALAMNMTTATAWSDVQQRFKPKLVKNRRRHRRRICEQGELQFVVAEHSARAVDLAKQAIAFKQAWIRDRGLAFDPFKDAVYREALWRMARGAEPKVACRVFAHELDGEPTAIDIAFNFKGRHYAHIAAMNLAYEPYGPGGLLTEDIMQSAFEHGERSYDLMAPYAAYKEEWTDTRTPVYAYAQPLTFKGWLLAAVYFGSLRPKLKALVNRMPPGLRRLLLG